MLPDTAQQLVDAAAATLRGAHRTPRHSVAAAACDSAGRVVTGVNVFHFTGGPCAEPVVVGRAVADPDVRLPLAGIAAVHDQGVIPPCGRCRQILFDLYPDIEVVVPGPDGLLVVGIRELLPHAYDMRSLEVEAFLATDRGSEGAP